MNLPVTTLVALSLRFSICCHFEWKVDGIERTGAEESDLDSSAA